MSFKLSVYFKAKIFQHLTENKSLKRQMSDTNKINQLWYFTFLLFGLRISPEKSSSTDDGRPNGCKSMWIIFLVSQIVSGVFYSSQWFYVTYHNCTLENIALLVKTCLTFFTSFYAAVVFYTRQNKINSLLAKLLECISRNIRLKSHLIYSRVCIFIFLLNSFFYVVYQTINFSATPGSACNTNATQIDNKTDCTKSIWLNPNLILAGRILQTPWVYSISYFSCVTITFFVHTCKLLELNFICLNYCVKNSAKAKTIITMSEIENWQRRHTLLCDWSKEISVVFSPLVAMWSFCCIVELCFIFRAAKLIYYNEIHVIFYFISLSFQIALLMIILHRYAASVYVEAEKTALLISAILSNYGVVSQNAYNMDGIVRQISFLQQFSKSNSGINVSGLYIITYGSILSMLGTFLTYTIILYQTS